jgi:hypothetical protein
MHKQTRSWRAANERREVPKRVFAGDDVRAVAAPCGLWHLSVHRIVRQIREPGGDRRGARRRRDQLTIGLDRLSAGKTPSEVLAQALR